MPTIRPWRRSCTENLRNSFPTTRWSISSSYYDYYQPEAYVPSTDTYIAKDALHQRRDRQNCRLSATAALCERRDVIVVSSVSCIYGLGAPPGILRHDDLPPPRHGEGQGRSNPQLINIQYTRNEMDFHRGTFRVKGDVLEIFPANSTDRAIRVEFFGDEIETDHGYRRTYRRDQKREHPRGDLPRLPLCGSPGTDQTGGGRHSRGNAGTGGIFQGRGQTDRSAAYRRADQL